MTVALDDWLGVMEREYTSSFIPEGGGAVRLVVAAPETLDLAAAKLREQAAHAGLQVIAVDLAETRLHMLQNLFFAIAAALPWQTMMQRRIEALVTEGGYRWPAPGRRVVLAALAEANEIAVHLLRRDLAHWLTSNVWHDADLAQDFRNAMIALLEAQLTGESDALRDAVFEWLRGELRTIARVKPAQIGAQIGRHNARAMLMSLCHWVRDCGQGGMLVLLDIRRLHLPKGAAAEGLYYTPAAVMDCYEVLRQVIDDAEHFPGLFLVALADPAALTADSPRAIGKYTALQMRVVDDVRPHGRDNPLAPLVRVAA
jgi:hypothetical protein